MDTLKDEYPVFSNLKAILVAGGVIGVACAALGQTGAAAGTTNLEPFSVADLGQTNAPVRLPSAIVTAQRQPAAVESLPVSVSPVLRETLESADVNVIKDAELFAPNVFINEFTARKLSNPYFRGIGASPNNPGVTTYIDGVPQLNANSSSIELLDVEQVEFVRGPQGALFGRNTVGGLINISSRRPSMAWQADFEEFFGNYSLFGAQGSVSGPLVREQLAMSVGLGYSQREGYTKNDLTGHSLDDREALFGKGQLLWVGPNDWEFRFVVTGERDRDGDYALGDLEQIRSRPHHVAHDFEGYTHREIIAPTLLAERQGERTEFASATGLVWWKTRDVTDLDYSPIPAVTRDNEEKDFQFTEELRLGSRKDAPIHLADSLGLGWQAGLSGFVQNYEQDAVNSYAPGILYQPGSYGPGIPPFASPANSRHAPEAELDDFGVGAFLQSTLTAWEKLDFSAGVRGDYEHKEANLRTYFSTPDPFLGPGTVTDADEDFFEVTHQLSLAYRLAEKKSVYASAGRGYKAGGFNPLAPTGFESYDPEYSWNYEIGAKTLWWNERLSVNLALFYINWDELQLNQPSGAPGQFYIANAGSAESKGVELELKARPLAGWDLFGTFGYADARFLSDARAGRTDPAGADSLIPVGGNHLIYTPDYTASGGMQYTWQITQAWALYARGEAAAFGRFYYNPANTASQDAYTLANFRAGVRASNFFVEGWVRNAFDTEYVPVAFEFPNGAFGGSGFVGESGAPLTFGFRAGLTF